MNHTVITEFVRLGLSDDPDVQIVAFLFLSVTYVLSAAGSLTTTALTWVDSPSRRPCVSSSKLLFLRTLLYCRVHP